MVNINPLIIIIYQPHKMSPRIPLLLLFLSLTLLLPQTTSTLLDDFISALPPSHEEIDQVIVKEFVKERHTARDVKGLMQEYIGFKRAWTERMVEFLIKELEINEEGAREARKNPDSFFINFDTYKLFASSF